jgi:DNA-binding NarL/FixJ family response regulator
VSENPVRVLVADDHAIVRTGIRHVLESEPGFVVVAEASTGPEALELAESLRPDVVVLDITMPGISGLHIAARLRERAPETQVLILSMHDNTEYVLESLRAGVHGYLLKDTAATELRGAIRAVRRGESFFSPPIAGRRSAVLRGEANASASDALAQLTGRERQVLLGIAQGHTNREIGAQLGISPRTVESHRENLMRKLGVRTVAGLTRLALEAGLVPD